MLSRTLTALTGILLLACGRPPPDRSNSVQVPLFFVILAIPFIASAVRRAHPRIPVALCLAQLVVYLLYESGVSVQTNIRIDLLLILPAIVGTLLVAIDSQRRSRKKRRLG